VEGAVVYVGFRKRLIATVIDIAIMLAVCMPLLWAIYGNGYFSRLEPFSQHLMTHRVVDPALLPPVFAGTADFVIQIIVPVIALFVLWRYRAATPGKMLVHARIADAKSLGAPSTGQLVVRFFAYLASMIPLFLGFFWIAFDARKQGWHDKIAGTVVIADR
jgi:uncharacterized RDD family membrane protein YckC